MEEIFHPCLVTLLVNAFGEEKGGLLCIFPVRDALAEVVQSIAMNTALYDQVHDSRDLVGVSILRMPFE